ncbi:MAG: GldG family protein [Clostridia bacterium]|nr:GldG family protein [Clostridia bacterium]
MKKLKLNTKYLKTGGYSVLVSIIALAIVIVINLFANTLPATWTKLDTSSGDMFSIGEQTVEFVKGLKEDITVYYVVEHGSEDKNIQTMLDKYSALSGKIKVENVDPALNPAFLTGDRATVEAGSIIVESAKRNKIIKNFEVYYPGVSMEELESYYYTYQKLPAATGFDMENLMTTAINYVTTDVLPIVYTLTGHGEDGLSDTYKGYLSAESFEVKELNLATLEAVPEDCDTVLINLPDKDISEDEAARLLDYLKKGGKMFFISYFADSAEAEHTNLQTVLDYYGVSAVEGEVFEGDSNYHYPQYPFILLAQYGRHEIVDPLSGYYMFMGYCHGIEQSEDVRDAVTITPLLSTTDKAYSKVNLNSSTITKEDGDIDGPFDYAVAITDKNEDGSEAKIVWIASPMILEASSDYYGTVKGMFVNTFGWLCDKAEAISIPAKTIEQEYLNVSEAQGNLLAVVFTIVLPLAAIATGFVVWLRRRSK